VVLFLELDAMLEPLFSELYERVADAQACDAVMLCGRGRGDDG
jgi:hypothetical protein